MPSGAVLSVQNPLAQILPNIAAGTHPVHPTNKPSALEHFINTKYHDVIRPTIDKRWNEQKRIHPTNDLHPPTSFREQVSVEVFDALSEVDHERLKAEVELEWTSTKELYQKEVRKLYGFPDAERCMQAMPDFLRPIMATLEAMTGMKLIVWAGGSMNKGVSIFNITSDSTQSEVPVTMPQSQTALFERAAQEWMQERNNVFIGECVRTIAPPCPPSLRIPSTELSISRIGHPEQVLDAPTFYPLAGSEQIASLLLEMSSSMAPIPQEDRDTAGIPKSRKRKSIKISSSQPAPSKKPRPTSSQIAPITQPPSNSTVQQGVGPSTSAPLTMSISPRKKRNLPDALGLSTRSKASKAGQSTTHISTHSQDPGPSSSSSMTAPSLYYTKPPKVTIYPASTQALIDTIPSSIDWLTQPLLDILKEDLGSTYHQLVALLIELESLHGSVSTKARLGGSRPAELKLWVNTGRGQRKRKILVDDVVSYAKVWWNWWRDLQPKWRKFDLEGKPISVIPESHEKGWSCLFTPGTNGMLGVVATLYWWGCAVDQASTEDEDGSMKDWEKAMGDCILVMEAMIKLLKKGKGRVIEGAEGGVEGREADGEKSDGEGGPELQDGRGDSTEKDGEKSGGEGGLQDGTEDEQQVNNGDKEIDELKENKDGP